MWYWLVRTRNSWSPISSRSFRTQSHWSFITGQCINSGQFLRVHLSHRMCNQSTLHHWIQDWYGDDNIWAKDRRYSSCLWILWTEITKILIESTWKHRVLLGTCRQRGRNIKTRCFGSISNLLKRKDLSSIRCDRTPSSFKTHSQPIVSRRLSRWKLEKSYTKVYASPLPPPKISFKDFWMKELDSEVARSSKDTQRIQPKPKTQLSRTGRSVGEQPAGSFTQETGRCLVWSRKHRLKHEKELCASVRWTCR